MGWGYCLTKTEAIPYHNNVIFRKKYQVHLICCNCEERVQSRLRTRSATSLIEVAQTFGHIKYSKDICGSYTIFYVTDNHCYINVKLLSLQVKFVTT